MIPLNRQKSSTNWFRNKLNLSCQWMSFSLRIFSNLRSKPRENDSNNNKNYIKWTNKLIRTNFKNCLKNKVNKLLFSLHRSKPLKNRNRKYNSSIKLYLLYLMLNFSWIRSLKMISKILGKNLGVSWQLGAGLKWVKNSLLVVEWVQMMSNKEKLVIATWLVPLQFWAKNF